MLVVETVVRIRREFAGGIVATQTRTVRIQTHARIRHVPGHRNRLKTENPIANRLGPAGSGLQDFRTPAGIRNSSGERPDRFGARGRVFGHSFTLRREGTAGPISAAVRADIRSIVCHSPARLLN